MLKSCSKWGQLLLAYCYIMKNFGWKKSFFAFSVQIWKEILLWIFTSLGVVKSCLTVKDIRNYLKKNHTFAITKIFQTRKSSFGHIWPLWVTIFIWNFLSFLILMKFYRFWHFLFSIASIWIYKVKHTDFWLAVAPSGAAVRANITIVVVVFSKSRLFPLALALLSICIA